MVKKNGGRSRYLWRDLHCYLCGRRMNGSFKGTMVSVVWAEMEKSWKKTKTINDYEMKNMQRQAIETFIKGKKCHLLYKNRKERTSQIICHIKDWNSLSSLISSLFFSVSAVRSLHVVSWLCDQNNPFVLIYENS